MSLSVCLALATSILSFVLGLRLRAAGRRCRRLEADALRLRDLAERDPLTGLRNRRVLDAAVTHIARDAALRARSVVAVLDIDAFKAVNDRFGHQRGDALLRAVGRALRGAVRPEDLLCRLGGDEFVVVAASAGEHDDPTGLGRRLADAVRDGGRSVGLDVTASIGVAVGEANATWALVAQADGALYRAKRRGGGCVVLHSVPAMPAAS